MYAEVVVGIMYVLFVDYSRDGGFSSLHLYLLGLQANQAWAGMLGNVRFRLLEQIRS